MTSGWVVAHGGMSTNKNNPTTIPIYLSSTPSSADPPTYLSTYLSTYLPIYLGESGCARLGVYLVNGHFGHNGHNGHYGQIGHPRALGTNRTQRAIRTNRTYAGMTMPGPLRERSGHCLVRYAVALAVLLSASARSRASAPAPCIAAAMLSREHAAP